MENGRRELPVESREDVQLCRKYFMEDFIARELRKRSVLSIGFRKDSINNTSVRDEVTEVQIK